MYVYTTTVNHVHLLILISAAAARTNVQAHQAIISINITTIILTH